MFTEIVLLVNEFRSLKAFQENDGTLLKKSFIFLLHLRYFRPVQEHLIVILVCNLKVNILLNVNQKLEI